MEQEIIILECIHTDIIGKNMLSGKFFLTIRGQTFNNNESMHREKQRIIASENEVY
jgi:hypothetical protein